MVCRPVSGPGSCAASEDAAYERCGLRRLECVPAGVDELEHDEARQPRCVLCVPVSLEDLFGKIVRLRYPIDVKAMAAKCVDVLFDRAVIERPRIDPVSRAEIAERPADHGPSKPFRPERSIEPHGRIAESRMVHRDDQRALLLQYPA